MDSVPPYAAVSQSVDQVRDAAGQGAGGLVNAVLRKVAAAGDGPDLFPDFDDQPADFLTHWGSHPRWLIDRWLARWGPVATRALVDANNRRPRFYLVPLDSEPADAAAQLAVVGIPAEPVGLGTRCLRLAEGVSPAEAFGALPHAVAQDPAANLVAIYADVPIGTKVADLCAAPGGKTLAVSHRPRYTLALDRSEARLRMVRDNAARTERSLGLVVADARRPPLRDVDVVLLDAPCTGTGTLQRRPDARWRLRPDSVGELASLQRDMLDAAADTVASGGLLIYSTCSLELEENELRIEAFLAARPDFRVEATDAVPSRWLDARGHLSVTPQEGGFDGAFAARLRRVS
jgi:16S rRNA (cytosine967-C5)-methyltransferase